MSVQRGHVAWLQSYIVILPPAAGGGAVVTWRGWWKAAGFTPPSELIGVFLAGIGR